METSALILLLGCLLLGADAPRHRKEVSRMRMLKVAPVSICRAGVAVLIVSFGLGWITNETDARKRNAPPHVWYARPDSAWAVAGFGQRPREDFERLIAQRPPELADAFKAVEIQVREEGVWLTFSVWFKRVHRVVFTKNTKFVLIHKSGRRIESEAFIFWPDLAQTSLFDSRKSPIPVSKKSVWCAPNNGSPIGFAKFPAGSIELRDMASFEVVGAVEDTTYLPPE